MNLAKKVFAGAIVVVPPLLHWLYEKIKIAIGHQSMCTDTYCRYRCKGT